MGPNPLCACSAATKSSSESSDLRICPLLCRSSLFQGIGTIMAGYKSANIGGSMFDSNSWFSLHHPPSTALLYPSNFAISGAVGSCF